MPISVDVGCYAIIFSYFQVILKFPLLKEIKLQFLEYFCMAGTLQPFQARLSKFSRPF